MFKMSGDERQTRTLTGIDTMLTSAAAETAALWDTMVHKLKEELSRILQENEELKSKCSYLEFRLTNQPKPDIQGGGSEHGRGAPASCEIGVQCDLCCNEQGLQNSLQGTMEQQNEEQRRGDYQNQQHPVNIYGEGHSIKDGILEPAMVHRKVPKNVPDPVTPLEKGQKVDHNIIPTAGNMLCHFERVEESDLESSPGEGPSQKISQQVFRVDETMAIEDNVTMQTSLNSEVISEHHIQLSDEVSFSMKGASCDSEIDLKEIRVDVQTKSSAQLDNRRSPLERRLKGKALSPTVNLHIRNTSIISAATSRRGRPPKKASLSELHTQPDPETSPVTGRPGRRPRSCVKQLPCQGTMSPSPSSDILLAKKAPETPSKHEELEQDSRVPCLAASLPRGYFSEDAELSGLHQVYKEMEEDIVPSAAEGLEPPLSELPKSKSMEPRKPSHNPERQEALLCAEAINPQISTLDSLDKTSSQPKMTVPAQTLNTADFTSSNAHLSVSISSVSPQTKAKDHASYPSALVCQVSNSLPTLDHSTKINSVPQLPLGTGNSDVSASTPSAVVPSKTLSKSSTKLKPHAVITQESNTALGATCTRAQSHPQNSFTSISTVEDRLGISNAKNMSQTTFPSTQPIIQRKPSNLPDIEENAACLKTENMVSQMRRTCFVNCGPKSLPTTLAKILPSTAASTQSQSATITGSCSVPKTLPVSSPSSSSSNKAFTKGRTVKALKQVAQEATSAASVPLNSDPVHPHPELTKTMFFVQLSMAPVVPQQEKESLNDSVDCVVAETATHNTKRPVRKGHVKRLKGAGPTHGTETAIKPTEDFPKVEHLETDEYCPDKAGELAQKPDAASPKYNSNKPTPLKGFRLATKKLKPSAKKRKLNPKKPRPKESFGLVNTAFTLKTIKTEAVWIPPILEDSKPPLGSDSCCDWLPPKWSTRYATPERLTSPRLVTRKHWPPFTPSGSSPSSNNSAPRTAPYSHSTAAQTSPLPSPSQPFSVKREPLLRNQCEHCGRVLSSKAALHKHIKLHSGKKLFSCTLCSEIFPDSQSLTRHGRVHRNGKIYICPQCNEGFAYRFGLTQHLQMVHSRIKPFVCHICQKSYFWRKDFESHLRVHTGTTQQFPCDLCDKIFNRRVELDSHLRSHSREKRHCCTYCGKQFLDYNNLKRHRYTHTGERPYSCAHCTKSFVQSGHLKKHLRNVHKVDVYADLL